MENDVDRRMIHIRIDNELHKELRKVAAEFDGTIQDIVARAVEERVEELRERILLEKEKELLELEARCMQMENELDNESPESDSDGIPYDPGHKFKDYHVSVIEKLDRIQESIENLQELIQRD